MSRSARSNQPNESNGSQVLDRRDRPKLARNGTPLNLAEDENLTEALRLREDAFHEDVLPAGAELKAPSDFYEAIDVARVMGSRKQRLSKPRDKRSMLFPHLAA
jgi:hypothetical protein